MHVLAKPHWSGEPGYGNGSADQGPSKDDLRGSNEGYEGDRHPDGAEDLLAIGRVINFASDIEQTPSLLNEFEWKKLSDSRGSGRIFALIGEHPDFPMIGVKLIGKELFVQDLFPNVDLQRARIADTELSGSPQALYLNIGAFNAAGQIGIGRADITLNLADHPELKSIAAEVLNNTSASK